MTRRALTRSITVRLPLELIKEIDTTHEHLRKMRGSLHPYWHSYPGGRSDAIRGLLILGIQTLQEAMKKKRGKR